MNNNYSYDERNDLLTNILQIENQNERADALEAFIVEERVLLGPVPRSHALDIARRQLHAIQNPPVHNPTPAKRRLF